MNLVYNERTKLLANALSNSGIATIVTAFVAPLAGMLYGSASPNTGRWWPLIGFAWFSGGLILHLSAQMVLGRLRE